MWILNLAFLAKILSLLNGLNGQTHHRPCREIHPALGRVASPRGQARLTFARIKPVFSQSRQSVSFHLLAERSSRPVRSPPSLSRMVHRSPMLAARNPVQVPPIHVLPHLHKIRDHAHSSFAEFGSLIFRSQSLERHLLLGGTASVKSKLARNKAFVHQAGRTDACWLDHCQGVCCAQWNQRGFAEMRIPTLAIGSSASCAGRNGGPEE
mmetsp:Transcript_18988/g.44502  ORF Transcript_18988/g.44502 Transcript_18988/m.44502 type:complete len:209 (-) Transcript_18988:22-648(-)